MPRRHRVDMTHAPAQAVHQASAASRHDRIWQPIRASGVTTFLVRTTGNGQGGIRTRETLARLHAFQAQAHQPANTKKTNCHQRKPNGVTELGSLCGSERDEAIGVLGKLPRRQPRRRQLIPRAAQ